MFKGVAHYRFALDLKFNVSFMQKFG
jgi:hypothetical protein